MSSETARTDKEIIREGIIDGIKTRQVINDICYNPEYYWNDADKWLPIHDNIALYLVRIVRYDTDNDPPYQKHLRCSFEHGKFKPCKGEGMAFTELQEHIEQSDKVYWGVMV